MKAYQKLDKMALLKSMTLSQSNPLWRDSMWSISSVSRVNKTSKYQAQRTLKQLREEWFIKYISVVHWCSCYEYHECWPEDFIPRNWNIPTEKARALFQKEIKRQEDIFFFEQCQWHWNNRIIEEIL